MKGIRIRPEQDGLRTSLFDLEAEIMELVWDKDWQEFAVADVHKALERARPIAYTTVMTTVARLYDKEVLQRRSDGRRYLYQPRLSRQAFAETLTREVLNSLPPEGHEAAVAFLIDRVATADDDELARLEALISARRRRSHE